MVEGVVGVDGVGKRLAQKPAETFALEVSF